MLFAEYSPYRVTTRVAKTVTLRPMAGRPPKKLAHYPNRLRQIREAKGVDLVDLATSSGIPYKNLQRYEVGARKLPTHLIQALSKALDVRPQELLEGYQALDDRQEVEMLDIFRQLPAADRDRLIRMARGLLPTTGNIAVS